MDGFKVRINTNANANSAWTSYTNNQDKLRKSMSRLSTGVIQSTDDPAGIGISERMRAQAKGTEMARFNTDNAISLVQTADSWLQKVNDMLSRMKSLSVEAAGIMSTTDKENLQVEFEAMQDEITRITSKDTAAGKFNGLYMFRGGNGTTGKNDSVKTTGGVPAQATGSQQRITASADSTIVAMAGGGYIVSNDAIDGSNPGFQLFDDDGNKIGGANVSVASLSNITALKTGGFVVTTTEGNIQRYDRYGNQDGSEVELESYVTGTASIKSMSNGNVLIATNNEVQLIDFSAEATEDQVYTVKTKDGADLIDAKIAVLNDNEFWVLSESEETARRFDMNGVEISGSEISVDLTTGINLDTGNSDIAAMRTALEGDWLPDAVSAVTSAYGLTTGGADLNVSVEYLDGRLNLMGLGGTDASGNGTMTLDSTDMDEMMISVLDGSNVDGDFPGAPINAQQLIAHEMVHVMQFLNGLSTPTWFSEGAAESVSDSGEDRVAQIIAAPNTYNTVEDILDGASFFNAADGTITDTWNGSNVDYAAAYLLVQSIDAEDGGGGAGVTNIFADMIAGDDFYTAVDKAVATGLHANLNAFGGDLEDGTETITNAGGYEEPGDLTANTVNASGGDLSMFGSVSYSLAGTAPISMAATKNGGVVIANPKNGQIQRYDSDGNENGEEIVIDLAKRKLGEVTALNDGGFIVLNTDTDDKTLYATRYSEDGSLFEEIQVNNGRDVGEVATAEIAVLSDGSFVVEWDQSSDNATEKSSYIRKFDMESGIRLQIGADLNQALTLDMPDLQVTNHQIIGDYTKVDYDSENNVTGETTKDVRWSEIIDSNKLNVSSDDVIGKLDVAINFVSKSRASIAAQQNRLQNTKEGLLSYQDNLNAAESTIRDVDMAKESTNFSKTQIVTNASNAILAQANGLPNSVLQLLG